MMPIDYHNPNDYWKGYDPYKGMTDGERMKAGCLQGAAFIITIIIALLLCALLGSCTTTKYVPVISHSTDTLIQTRTQYDSIYLSDSIYISDFVRTDTVFRTLERWHTQYRDRWRHDTIYQARHDTVPQPYPVEIKVPRELTWWQKTLQRTGGIALILLLVWVGRMAWKIYTKRFY